MKQDYTLTVYAEDQVGLLSRIAIIFSRRKINIDSLNTCPSEIEGIHRFTILISETEEVVKKLCRQIEKQVEVLKAYFHTNNEIVWQELALFDVRNDVQEQSEVSAANPQVVERLLSLTEKARKTLGDGEAKGTEQREAGWVEAPVPLLLKP